MGIERAATDIGLRCICASASRSAEKTATSFPLKFRMFSGLVSETSCTCPYEVPLFLVVGFKVDTNERSKIGARRGTKTLIVILSYPEKNKKKKEEREGEGEKKRERVYKGYLLLPRAPMCPEETRTPDTLDFQQLAEGHVLKLTCPYEAPCAPKGHPVTHTETA